MAFCWPPSGGDSLPLCAGGAASRAKYPLHHGELGVLLVQSTIASRRLLPTCLDLVLEGVLAVHEQLVQRQRVLRDLEVDHVLQLLGLPEKWGR